MLCRCLERELGSHQAASGDLQAVAPSKLSKVIARKLSLRLISERPLAKLKKATIGMWRECANPIT